MTMASRTLAGLLGGVVALVGACRGAGDDDGGDGGPGGADAAALDDTIYDVQSAAIANGAAVTLHGVVVTHIDTYGGRTGSIYVAEPQEHPTHGRAYGGVLVFLSDASAAELEVGDLINVEGGVKDEFAFNCDEPGVDCSDTLQTLTEVSAPQGGAILITKVGTGQAPEAVAVSSWMLAADPAEAEKWESVLVRFEDVAVTTAPHGISSSDATLKEMTVTGPFDVTSSLAELADTIARDDCYTSITGIGEYFFDYRIMPRGAADLVAAADNSGCLYENDATECGDGSDNDYDGYADCADFSCQDVIADCTSDTTIVAIQDGTIATGSSVALSGVVVAAVDADREHLWIQDAGAGVPYNGLYVYRGASPVPLAAEVHVGTTLDITGTVSEHYDLTELKDVEFSAVSETGTASVLSGAAPADLAGMLTGEPYEGVLVELTNAPVVNPDAGFGTFTVGDAAAALIVDDVIYKYTLPGAGTCFTTLRGVMHYSYSERKLYPRDAADLVPCP
jgi:predicted extracellular nuclease